MNRISKLLFSAPLLLLGCNSISRDKNTILQKIDNLNLDIFSNKGEKIYTVKSPYTIYDVEKTTFDLQKTTINVYKDNIEKYIIYSDNSKLSDNNKIIELEGNVQLKTILQDNDILYANNFIWNVDESRYLLDGDVKFENNLIILFSNKASMNSDNVIEFFNPVKYIIKNKDTNNKRYEISSENAFYNILTKSVIFKSKEKKVLSTLYL